MKDAGKFLASWYILLPFRIFYSHLVCFVFILVLFSRFGMSYQEKSGNPGQNVCLEISVYQKPFFAWFVRKMLRRQIVDKNVSVIFFLLVNLMTLLAQHF
jgi:hypothetical protein